MLSRLRRYLVVKYTKIASIGNGGGGHIDLNNTFYPRQLLHSANDNRKMDTRFSFKMGGSRGIGATSESRRHASRRLHRIAFAEITIVDFIEKDRLRPK